jgi:hypothetical protein
MHIFTTNIPTFHSRYRKYVLITNEFHEFCSFTISGTSNDGKASYRSKSIHMFIMSKTRGSHWQYDTRGWCGTKPGPSRATVRPAGQGLASFWNLSSTHVNLSQQEKYPLRERRCYHKAWPPGQVKWSAGLTSEPPEPKLHPRHWLNPPINTLLLLLVESVKKVRFSPL